MKHLILNLATLTVVLMGNCVAQDSVDIFAWARSHANH